MSKQDSRANTQEVLPIDEKKPDVSSKNGRKNNAPANQPADRSRRSFLNKAGGLTAMAVAAAMVPLEPLLGGKESTAEASVITYAENTRANNSFEYRRQEAQAEKISPPVAPDNGCGKVLRPQRHLEQDVGA